MPRILVINPTVKNSWQEETRIFYSEHAQKGTSIDVVNIDYGPSTHVGYGLSRLLTSIFVVEKAMWAEQQKYDATIVNCFGDPGVKAARHVVSIPITGPGEATLHVASILGNRISIIDIGDPSYCTKSSEYFLTHPHLRKFNIVSARHIGPKIGARKFLRDLEKTYRTILEKGRECIKEDNAHIIVFGCTAMSCNRFAEKLQKDLGIPVLDPASTALAMTELLVSKNLTHSSKAYIEYRDTEPVLPNKLRWALAAYQE